MPREIWNPWEALRARGDTTCLAYLVLDGPHGRWERDQLGDVILLDVTLGRRARRVALAHELVHAERGIGHPVASEATMQLEEERVRREVARRLVPPDRLRRFARRRRSAGPLSAADVAAEFDVTDDVAELACWLLRWGG